MVLNEQIVWIGLKFSLCSEHIEKLSGIKEQGIEMAKYYLHDKIKCLNASY